MMFFVGLFAFIAATILAWLVSRYATHSGLSVFLYSWLVVTFAGIALQFSKGAARKKVPLVARTGAALLLLLSYHSDSR